MTLPSLPLLAGAYEWRPSESGTFLDLETIDLRPDGTYAAKVEATLVNPRVRSFAFPCTLEETGTWNVYTVAGRTKVRLRPSTNRARVYEARVGDRDLALRRRGTETTLFSRR